MRRLSIRTAVVAAALACGCAHAQDTAVWRIGERDLPPPAGASEAFQATFEGAPAPSKEDWPEPPKTAEEWEAMVASRGPEGKAFLENLKKELGGTVETEVIRGVTVYRVTPAKTDPAHKNHLFLHAHGGAYVFGGGPMAASEALMIAAAAGVPVISVDYRMPPSHPSPAAVDDMETVYAELIKTWSPSAIAIGGTSAGGGLALAAVHRLKATGAPMPGAIFAGTPWTDLTKTSDTLFTNEGVDRVLVTYDGVLRAAAELYAGDTDL